MNGCVHASCLLLPQILARALGGSVGPNPDGDFVLTIEQIQPTQQLQQFKQLHNAVQQALAAETARGGSSSVSVAAALGSSSSANAVQAAAAAASAAAAAGEAVNDVDPAAVADALESMSISSSANNVTDNGSDNDGAGSDVGFAAAVTAAAAASREAAAAASSGCFRLIESHGDQVTLRAGKVARSSLLLCSALLQAVAALGSKLAW
jgi:hypothetical protein